MLKKLKQHRMLRVTNFGFRTTEQSLKGSESLRLPVWPIHQYFKPIVHTTEIIEVFFSFLFFFSRRQKGVRSGKQRQTWGPGFLLCSQ